MCWRACHHLVHLCVCVHVWWCGWVGGRGQDKCCLIVVLIAVIAQSSTSSN